MGWPAACCHRPRRRVTRRLVNDRFVTPVAVRCGTNWQRARSGTGGIGADGSDVAPPTSAAASVWGRFENRPRCPRRQGAVGRQLRSGARFSNRAYCPRRQAALRRRLQSYWAGHDPPLPGTKLIAAASRGDQAGVSRRRPSYGRVMTRPYQGRECARRLSTGYSFRRTRSPLPEERWRRSPPAPIVPCMRPVPKRPETCSGKSLLTDP